MAEPQGTQTGTQDGGATGGAPPPAPPSPPTPPSAPATPPQPPAPPAAPDADDFKLSREQFNDRITQAKTTAQKEAEKAQREWLAKKFGTDSSEEIDKKLAAWQKLEKDREAAERAQMSEAERYKADLERERKAREAAEKEVASLRSTYLYEKQDNVISRLAAPHVNDKYLAFAKKLFATHLKDNVGAEAAKKMTEKDVSAWFKKDFAREYPELAKASDAAPPKAPTKKPVSNGPAPNDPKPPANQNQPGRTARPGQQNSMSKKELKEHLKNKGLSGW